MVRCECSDEVNGSDIGPGLVNGLLIAIPIWVIIGVVLALEFELGPMEETSSVVSMIAAVWESILLRPYLPTLRTRFRRYMDSRRADSWRNAGWPKSTPSNEARPVVAPQALLRQSLALSALVGAYLQYYFLEVNLQIASLNSVTVFVPMASMT